MWEGVCYGEGADTLAYRLIMVEHKYGQSGDSLTCCIAYSVSYPLFTEPGSRSADSLNAFVRTVWLDVKYGLHGQSIDSSASGLIEGFKVFKEEEPGPSVHWEEQLQIDVHLDMPNYVSLSYFHSGYMGGIHPNSQVYLASFDAKSGRKLELGDLLMEGFQPALDSLAEGIFRDIWHLPKDSSLTSAGYNFPSGKFALNNNWLIDTSGLTFYYNEYEINSYADGPTRLRIPWSALYELISESALIYRKYGR
jgi:hypothetical protein